MKKVFLSLAALVIVGCGGGGSSTSSPPSVPQTTITGTVFASAKFTSGVVKAYGFIGGGGGVGLLASTTISSVGAYQLSVPSSSGAILIVADSGCYTEKAIPWNAATGQYPSVQNTISASVCAASPVLSAAVVVPVNPATLVVAVTPYTHAAVGLAEYEIRNSSDVSLAVNDANSRFSQWVGANILTTLPASPARASTLSGSTLYGSLLSGIPSWLLNVAKTEPAVFGAGTLTTLAFANAMYSDLSQDGVLNGVGRDANGNAVALSVGNSAMTSTIYRHQLALWAVARVRAETEGALNATFEEQARIVSFLPSLVAYNDAIYSLLDATALVALDEGGPTVIIGGPAPGATLSGNDGMAGFVHDHVGISALDTIIMVDGVKHTEVFNQYIPNHFINTTIFSNGPHTLSIRATNNLGHVTTASVNVNFSN